MANNNTVQIGTALKWRGVYDDNKKYYQDNIVSLHGCVFRCKPLYAIGYPPVEKDLKNGELKYINTDVWDVVVDFADYYGKFLAQELVNAGLQQEIDEIDSILESHQHAIDGFGNVIEAADTISVVSNGLWKNTLLWVNTERWYNPKRYGQLNVGQLIDGLEESGYEKVWCIQAGRGKTGYYLSTPNEDIGKFIQHFIVNEEANKSLLSLRIDKTLTLNCTQLKAINAAILEAIFDYKEADTALNGVAGEGIYKVVLSTELEGSHINFYPKDYLTKWEASNNYQPKGNYLTAESPKFKEVENTLSTLQDSVFTSVSVNGKFSILPKGQAAYTLFISTEGAIEAKQLYQSGSLAGITLSLNTTDLVTQNDLKEFKEFLFNSEGIEGAFDTLYDVDKWIKEHNTEAADILSRQTQLEQWRTGIENRSFVDSIDCTADESQVNIILSNCDLKETGQTAKTTIPIQSATKGMAGVMSATDKALLDTLVENAATKQDLSDFKKLADETYATKAALALKSDKDTVESALALKADKSTMASELAEKADIEDLSNVLGEEVLDDNTVEDWDVTTKEQIEGNLKKYIEENKERISKELFIKKWNILCAPYGKYNEETGFFELNGLTDITYEQAIAIASLNRGWPTPMKPELSSLIRTNILDLQSSLQYNTIGSFAFKEGNYEVIRVSKDDANQYTGASIGVNAQYAFNNLPKLRKILGTLILSNLAASTNQSYLLTSAPLLEEVNLCRVSKSLNLSGCPKLSLASFKYLVTYAGNTTAMTITVHADVYTKLTSDEYPEWQQLLSDAAAKNISFAKP